MGRDGDKPRGESDGDLVKEGGSTLEIGGRVGGRERARELEGAAS